MEKIKTYWKEILIAILVLFGLNKCAQSCNRQTKIDNANISILAKDSIIKSLNDSLYILDTKLKVYEEKINGLNQSLTIQDEANKRISEAKKNIQVNIKK